MLPLGDVGDDPPPHAVTSVASVAPDAIWQAPVQNRRREMGVYVSDIALVLVWAVSVARGPARQDRGHAKTGRFLGVRGTWVGTSITDWEADP
jgi:hypothetical protein